jgi:hypothetical protein
MDRFVSATGQFLLATYEQFSCPPMGSFSCPLTTLCDGPISSDGSWSRECTIWAPAHYVPGSCLGGSSSSSPAHRAGWYAACLLSSSPASQAPQEIRPQLSVADQLAAFCRALL